MSYQTPLKALINTKIHGHAYPRFPAIFQNFYSPLQNDFTQINDDIHHQRKAHAV